MHVSCLQLCTQNIHFHIGFCNSELVFSKKDDAETLSAEGFRVP